MTDLTQAPIPLPGLASSRIRRGSAICCCAITPLVVALGFESFFGRYERLYTTTILVVAAILLTIFAVLAFRGIRKEAAEIDAGYTTATKVWQDRRYLWAFDAMTLKPIIPPIAPAELSRQRETGSTD